MEDADKLVGKLTEILEKIEGAVVQHAPGAMEVTLSVVRVEAIHDLVSAALALALMACAIRFLSRQYRKIDDAEIRAFAWGVSGAVLALPLLFACLEVFDAWNWVGIFQPELRLAKDIYDAAIGRS